MDDYSAPVPPMSPDFSVPIRFIYGDIDHGPTKMWMIHHRGEEDVTPLFELGFGKRPQEELYDLRNDPHYMNNVANDSEYEQIRADLNSRLMALLQEQNDPRVTESPPRFEQPPFAGPLDDEWHAENMRWLASRDPRLYTTVYGNRPHPTEQPRA